MRIFINYNSGRPHGLGGIVVDGASRSYVEKLRQAGLRTPDEILSIANARVHVAATTTGVASLRAGSITGIWEI